MATTKQYRKLRKRKKLEKLSKHISALGGKDQTSGQGTWSQVDGSTVGEIWSQAAGSAGKKPWDAAGASAVKKTRKPAGRRSRRTLPAAVLVAIMIVFMGGIGIVAVHYYTDETYMILNGPEHISVGKDGLFEDPGVTAKTWGIDVSDRVEITSDVDASVPGDYEITYRSGNFTASRTVTVLDHMSPELKLKGEQKIQLMLGDPYKEPGFSAKAEDGSSLTDQVQVSKENLRRAGKHTIVYSVTDDEGRTTRLSREVNIEPRTDYGSPGLPICMYHYVYDELNPPADVNNRWKNYISKQDLIEEMNWLNEQGYYYPTWDEVRDYIDGKLLLPDKSIVLTFDDGEMATLEQLKPIVEQTHVPVTSFLITVHKGKKKVRKFKGKYLDFESHTHDLHRGGGSEAYRGILPVIDPVTGVADLKKSIEICGSGKAIAYPYGDFNENVRVMAQEAGFLCGVTTQYNKAYPGMDPYCLPRVRMWQDQTLEHFISVVAPPEQTQTQTPQ